MIINNATIREAFQSFNTVFNKAFQEMENHISGFRRGIVCFLGFSPKGLLSRVITGL